MAGETPGRVPVYTALPSTMPHAADQDVKDVRHRTHEYQDHGETSAILAHKPYPQPTRVSPTEQKPRREKRNPCPQQRTRTPTRASRQTAGAEGVTYGNEHEHHTKGSESTLLARIDALGSQRETLTTSRNCTSPRRAGTAHHHDEQEQHITTTSRNCTCGQQQEHQAPEKPARADTARRLASAPPLPRRRQK